VFYSCDSTGPSSSEIPIQITFWSDRTGDGEIWVMDADGSGQTNLTNHPDFDGDPRWSPDAK
jgi:Tol biopolymer transport system component